MKNKINNIKTCTLKDLEEKNNIPKELLKRINNGDFNSINEYLDSIQKEDKDIMFSILYAVKNKFDTNIVFKYMGYELQKNNEELAIDILRQEPELLKDICFKNDVTFIAKVVNENPNIIEYIPENINSTELIYAIQQEKSLIEINSDIQKLETIEKIKEVLIKENLIETILEEPQNAEIDILIAVKEIKQEQSSDKAIEGFEEKIEELKVKISDNADNTDNKEEQRKVEQYQRHIKLMNKIKNGEIDSVRAAKKMLAMCKNMDEEYRKELEEIIRVDQVLKEKEAIEKEKLEKNANKEIKDEEIKDTSENKQIDKDNIGQSER